MPSPRPRARRAVALVGVLLSGCCLVIAPAATLAQDPPALAARCVTGGGPAGLCAQAAAAAESLGRSLAAFAAHGASSPDVQRTLGRRLPGGAPRVGFSLRPAFAGVRHPGLAGVPSPEVDEVQFGAQAALQVGLFEGFQPYPTVGGVLAADLLAGLGLLWLPTSEGYGGAVNATGLGARVGLMRESFTAPGIALTYAHVWLGAAEFGPAREVRTEPRVQTLRLAIGKDVGGVGLHLFVGRDWVDNDVLVQVPATEALRDGFETAYNVLAAGASLNYLVVRVEGEFGWAFAPANVEPLLAGFDPSEGTPLGGISVRVIF